MAAKRSPSRGQSGLWRKDFVLAIGINAVVMLVFYLLMTTMALYAAEEFRTSESLAGLVASMFVIGGVVARLAAGRIVAALGPRGATLLGLLGYVIAALVYLPDLSLTALLVLRLVHGFAFGVGSTAVNTIAQDVIPADRRGEGTGYFALSWPVASALGPFLALVLIDAWGYSALFLGCFIISVLGLLMALTIRPTPATPKPVGSPLQSIVAREGVALGSLMLLLGFGMSSLLIFLHPFTEEEGMAQAAGGFFLAYALATGAIRLVVGRVQDRWGDDVVMYPAIVCFALGLFIASRAADPMAIAVAGIVVGIGFGTAMPAAQAATVRMTGAGRTAVALATFFLFLDIGTGIGPLVLGAVIDQIGYRQTYAALALCMATMTLLYYAVHGRRSQGCQPQRAT